ncbi:MAG TPA: VCBS repeat-containing protein, partial [Candidatus Polarisedimenticolia bacterium]|nr:VCBS repeat-containing protein [Candidatus Polarisedimenticolia bacterium]
MKGVHCCWITAQGENALEFRPTWRILLTDQTASIELTKELAMHHRPCVRSVSFSLRCLLFLGLIPVTGAEIGAAPLFPDPLYSTYPYSTYTTVGSLDSVAIADFNGDQALDLAIAHSGLKYISILLARGNREFEPEHRHPFVGELSSIAAADFNGDGKPDLVVTDSMIDR